MNDLKIYDIVFVVALHEEAKILEKTLNANIDNEKSLGVYSFAELQMPASSFWQNLQVARLCLKDQGPENASNGTTALLRHCIPRILVSIGLSGKLSDACCLGDVVIAKTADNYSYRLRASKEGQDPAGRVKETTNVTDTINRIDLDDYLQGLEPNVDANLKIKLLKSQTLRKYPRVFWGDITSGSYLVDNKNFQEFLKKRNRLLLAVDMESQAVLEAASSMKYQGTTVVIRGISDPADGSKSTIDGKSKGRIRSDAMRAAVATFRFLCEDCFEWPVSNVINGRRAFRFRRPIADRLIQLVDSVARHLEKRTPRAAANEAIDRIDAKDPIISFPVLGEFAFRRLIGSSGEIPRRLAEKLQKSPAEVEAFLVAHFIIQSIRLANTPNRSKAVQALQHVYPELVNRYCKEIMNAELRRSHRSFFVDLKRAYALPHKTDESSQVKDAQRRAQIAYLMGRIDLDPFKAEATETLRVWRDELLDSMVGPQPPHPVRRRHSSAAEKGGEQSYKARIAAAGAKSNEHRLLLRTIQISLVQLGDLRVSDDYILECMASEEYDGQNRGFHLEYYGDIAYLTGERLSNKDDGVVDFPKTFVQLYSGLMDAEKRHPMHDIQLYTLLSLSHTRLMRGTLDEEKKKKIGDLFETIKWQSKDPVMEGYLLMVKEHFSLQQPRLTTTLEKLFSLKKQARRGWNDAQKARKVADPESIASHTFGAMVLAYMLLPETSDGERFGFPPDYSKDTILRYLLVHDLAEAWIGDLLPNQKNEALQKDEIEVFKKLGANYAYAEYDGKSAFLDWEEFEKGAGVNSLLARDFDVLDNLMQLKIESEVPGNAIPDLKNWVSYIDGRVSRFGRRFFAFLADPKEYYNQRK